MTAALARFPPGVPAIADDIGTLSAAALLAAGAAEARWLATTGATRVALLAANGRAWAIGDLALGRDGLVCVPLPHHFGPAQLAHALDSAGVQAVLTDDPSRILELDLGFAPAGASTHTGLALLARRIDLDEHPLPTGTVKITYTSGSTADPKGVCLTARTLEAVADSVAGVATGFRIGRHLALLPLATLLENVAGLYAAWLAGATCALPSAAAGAMAGGTLTPALLLDEVSRHAPHSLILVPELLRILVGGAERGWRPPADGRFFAVGGARVSPDLLERATRSGLPVFEGYGLSECGSVACLNTPQATRRGSVGRSLAHARVTVDGRGEIHVGGTAMAGYVGAPPLAAGATIATGDLGEIDTDGFVHVRGRLKNLFINSFGRNLSPEWIESELGQEPAIGQVVAFGEARANVVAIITPAGPGCGPPEIVAAVARANERLPPYARVVRHLLLGERFTVANGLATGNGRPRREEVLRRFADRIEYLYQEHDHVIC